MQSGHNTIVYDRQPSGASSKIYRANADGTGETELAQGFDPAYSSDGARIVYAKGGETSDIFVMNADGTGQVQVTQNYQSYAPAFSPDGSKIAFVSRHQSGTHIYFAGADGANQQRLNVPAEITGEHAPVWSPDGTKIYFIADKIVGGLLRNDIYAAFADNSGAVVQMSFMNALIGYDAPAIAPDGTRLLLQRQSKLRYLATDGSGTLTEISTSEGTDRQPSFAPNGAQIVFRRSGNLFVMNADGAEATALNVEGWNPSWNPTAVLPAPSPTATPTVTPSPTPTATPTATPTPAPTATPIPAADVAVQMSASASSVQVGGEVIYTIKTRNHGANAATNVRLNDNLPSQLDYVSLQTSQGACFAASDQINCQIGTVAPGAEVTVAVKTKVVAAGQIVNAASVAADEADPNQANNTASVAVQGVAGCPANVTSEVQVLRSIFVRNPLTRDYEQVVVLRNNSGRALQPRTALVFDNLTAGVSVSSRFNPGTVQCAAPLGSQYVLASGLGNQTEWRNGQIIYVHVGFANPQNRTINYRARVLNGAGNP